MSLHNISRWQQCGEGFLGVEKLKHVMADVMERTSITTKKRKCTESKIVTETTPERSGRSKRGLKEDNTLGVEKSHVKIMQDCSSAPWKQRDFLAEFSLDVSSPKSDYINWSTSSSDEGSPNESHAESKKRASINSGLRKRQRHSPKISTDVSLHSNTLSFRPHGPATAEDKSFRSQNLHPNAATDSHLTSQCLTDGQTECQGAIEITDDVPESKQSTSAKHLSKIVLSAQSNVNQIINKKLNLSSWTLSSFDDIRQSAAAGLKDLPSTRSSKLNNKCNPVSARKGSHLKSRAVRKLYLKEIQKSSDHISDVESDIEIQNIGRSQDDVDSDEDISSGVSCSSSDRKMGSQIDQDIVQDKCVQEEEGKYSQTNISIDTSSPCSSVQSEKIRASDWVKILQKQRTPAKEDQLTSTNFQDDSGKKKRKFARGSLADRLTQIINREKASVRFWHHSMENDAFDEKSNKSLLLKLVSLEKQYSVFMSRCLLMDESCSSVPCRAVFTCQTVGKLSLKPGMTVQVFAPWQQLDESGGMRTILCTHFVRVLPSVKPELGEHEVTEDNNCRISASAVWKCPCSTDPCLPSHACPAAQCPVVPHHMSQAVGYVGSSIVPSTTLHTVTALQLHPSVTTVSKRTLLESLEGMRGDASHLPHFTALVLRVFRHRVTGTLNQRLELLVEDAAGTLAIIRMTDVCGEILKALCKVEWKTCTFSGVHVISRTNRDKEPAFFKLIDQVWTQKFLSASSQRNDGDTPQLQHHASTPSFAYILHSASGVSTFAVEQDGAVKEASINLMTLQEAVRSESGTRVSFIAKALLPARFSQACGPTMNVFVYDSSVDMEGNTAVQRVEVGSGCVMEDIDAPIYLFRDVLVQKGYMQCDTYTLVLDMPTWNLWDVSNRMDASAVASVMSCSLKLPPFCCLSELGSLVTFEGSISAIDEKLAYSWEECETCGSDRLAIVEESGIIYCTGCNRQVISPVVRMRMEVYVTCKNIPSDVVIKLDLTQKTIESLLPSGAGEEGHDTELVIGKSIQCPACIVQSRESNASKVPQDSWMLTELRC